MTERTLGGAAANSVRDVETEQGRHHAFISYARRPAEQRFVDELCRELEGHGRRVWVDRSDIPPGADWLARIAKGIEGASSLIFVLSPDSAASTVCLQELSIALEQNKRVIPVLHQPVEAERLPPALARLNWISFTDDDDHEDAVAKLLDAIDTDLEWRDAHTRLTVRTNEWLDSARDGSFLLRGRDMRDAERWYAARESHREAPTAGQLDYIIASRRAASRRQRVLLGAVSLALAVAIGLAIYAVIERGQAVQQANVALSHQLATESASAAATDVRLESLLGLESFARAPATLQARSAVLGAAEQPLIGTMPPRGGEVEGVAYSPDGRLVAAGTQGGVELWNAATRTTAGPPLAAGWQANGVAFSPDGTLLAVADSKTAENGVKLGRVAVYRVATRATAHLFTGFGPATAVAFSPSGTELAIGTNDNGVYLWDLATGRRTHVAAPAHSNVLSVAFAPSGALAASGGIQELGGAQSGFAIVYATPSLAVHEQLPDINAPAPHVAFDPGGATLAVALDTGSVELFGTTSYRRTASIAVGPAVAVVAFNPAGTLLATGDYAGAIRLWDARTTSPAQVGETMENGSTVYGLAFAPDGGSLCAGGFDGGLLIWDSSGLMPLARLIPTGAAIDKLAIDARGREAVTVSGDGVVTARRLPSGAIIGRRAPKPGTHTIVTAPDSIAKATAVAIDYAGTTVAFGLADGDVLLGGPTLRGLTALPQGQTTLNVPVVLAFSADGRLLAAGDVAGDVALWRAHGARWQRVGSVHLGTGSSYVDGVTALAFTPSGRTLAVGTETTAALLDTRALAAAPRAIRTGQGIFSLAFTPGAGTLYAGDTAGNVELIDPAKPLDGPFATLPGDGNPIFELALSRDGRTLATGDAGGDLRLWDLTTRQPLGVTVPLRGTVTGASFARDSALVTADADGDLGVWPPLLLADALPPFAAEICPRLSQNLTAAQWRDLVGAGQPYHATCPR